MRAAAALTLLLVVLAAPARAAAAGSDRSRASGAFAALVARFQVQPGLYREDTTAAAGTYSTAWPLSQALEAAIALRCPRAIRALEAALARYWDGRAYESQIRVPYGPGGPVYYDDNEWIALDLLDAAAVDPQPWLVPRAQRIFHLVTEGWSRDLSLACPGGVRWGEESTDRNAVSTENGALLALRLYALTQRRAYLDWARTMDAWVQRCLRGPDGLVRDRVAVDGSVDGHTWSYNQGAAVAVGVGLARATGERGPLVRARQTAQATLAGGFADQPAVFVAIFFRDLAQLAPQRAPARAYAAAAWAQLERTSPSLLDQAALVDLYARG
jgi:hypothetical protein